MHDYLNCVSFSFVWMFTLWSSRREDSYKQELKLIKNYKFNIINKRKLKKELGLKQCSKMTSKPLYKQRVA